MKLKLFACLVVGALVTVTQAVAAPIFSPFLAVDLDGYNAGGGQSLGPTEAGFQGWEMAQGLFLDPSIDWPNSGASPAVGAPGLTKVFATSEGAITANLQGIAPQSERAARNRGANAGALSALYQDFVYAQRGLGGLGRHYVKLSLSGLNPGETYEFTAYGREPFNGGVGATDTSFMAWSDRATIGFDGPDAWLDANVSPGALYQPIYSSPADPMTDGTYKNPIPTLNRHQISGPDSADPYAYSGSFLTTANGAGMVEVYGWNDSNGYGGTQLASLIGGFQLAQVPEPASLILIGMGMIGLAVYRRR